MATIEKRKSKNGLTSFRAKIRLRGFPTQSATFSRLKDLRKWVQDTESSIRNGRYFENIEAKKHTFSETLDRYEKEILSTRPKTKAARKTQLKWWRDRIGSHLLCDITPQLLSTYRDELGISCLNSNLDVTKHRKPATSNRYLACLSHVFTVASTEWGWIENNPARKVRKLKEPRGRVRFLSEHERERLLDVCKKSDSPCLFMVVILAISTGARKMEILDLKWSDIDFQRGAIVLNDTKNGERRSLPLLGQALTELREHSKVRNLHSPLVFPNPCGDKPRDIRSAWETALKKAQIPDFRFHDLRHTCASYLAMNGATTIEIAQILGHKTLSMVKRYAHLSDSHVSEVVERMNAKVFG